nr:signal peptide peptidase-like [Tanacetum cinerariifolium]
MNWFQAAQPALLYIVPAVIGFLAAHCIWNGEVKPLLEFDESKSATSGEGNSFCPKLKRRWKKGNASIFILLELGTAKELPVSLTTKIKLTFISLPMSLHVTLIVDQFVGLGDLISRGNIDHAMVEGNNRSFIRLELDYLTGCLLQFRCESEGLDNTYTESLYSPEVLHDLNLSDIPNHNLALKVGAPIMLLRNINHTARLCNRIRLRILKLGEHVIEAQIITGSFVNVVKGNPLFASYTSFPDSPSLVLDDSCVNNQDLSRHVMGKVKDISSIPNLCTLLTKEGFPETNLTYLRELFAWTPIFLDCKVPEYISDDDVLHSASNNSIGPQQGSDDLVVDNNVEGVLDTIFDDNLASLVNCVCQSSEKVGEQQPDDLFGLYNLLKKHPKGAINESDPSLSHPLGFTPNASRQVDDPIGEGIDTGFVKESSPLVHSKVMNNSEEVHVKEVSKGNSEFRHSHNHKGGSILEVLDDMVRIGQSMGYDMDGCINEIEHIIGNQGDDAVFK